MSEMRQALSEGFGKIGRSWRAAKRQADKAHRVPRHRIAREREYSTRITIREVAFRVMEEAYNKASSHGRYPANARQIYYAARPAILARASATSLDSQYFTQTLLKDYLEQKQPAWDIVWDARGHFTEPHTRRQIGVGGINIRGYLDSRTDGTFEVRRGLSVSPTIETKGPDLRYGGCLFIEKEGFDPILQAARIAEKFDVAIVSTKGMPVSAACDLLGNLGLPVYVCRDFDKSGFSIVASLRRGTRGSRSAPAQVIDLGLRLEDVEGLETEPVSYGSNWGGVRANLRRNGATDEEIEVLLRRRVELNAMTSEQLIAWLEKKLRAAGAKKIVPDAKQIARAYERSCFELEMMARYNALIGEVDQVKAPTKLRALVAERLKDEPALSWDEVVWDIAKGNEAERLLDGGGDDRDEGAPAP